MKKPIGVFDSGVGGISVLDALASRLPEESFIYLGDTARLPYGTKSSETIRRYLEQNIKFLLQKNVKAIVVACNSASSALHEVENWPIPVMGVIESGAELAIQKTQNKRIGILATQATVSNGIYLNYIKKWLPDAEVYQQAAPLLVSLVEEGWLDDSITDQIIERYLFALMKEKIDVLILACTHFPFLFDAIQKITREKIVLINSGKAVAEKLAVLLKQKGLCASDSNRFINILLTDDSPGFQQNCFSWLKYHRVQTIEGCDLEK